MLIHSYVKSFRIESVEGIEKKNYIVHTTQEEMNVAMHQNLIHLYNVQPV